MKVTEFVKNKQEAHFHYYRAEHLYYSIVRYVDNIPENIYLFPVETADLKGATVNSFEKALHLMRYIRKAINSDTMVPLGVPFKEYMEKNVR